MGAASAAAKAEASGLALVEATAQELAQRSVMAWALPTAAARVESIEGKWGGATALAWEAASEQALALVSATGLEQAWALGLAQVWAAELGRRMAAPRVWGWVEWMGVASAPAK